MNEPGHAAHFKPPGWHCVTPRIITRQPREVVQFIKRVFAANGHYQDARPTVLGIGDSRLMISDAPIRTAFPPSYMYTSRTSTTLTGSLWKRTPNPSRRPPIFRTAIGGPW